MENYIIYEEIGKGEATTVYKGRRKETINFVAVLSIQKSRRAAVTNWVRIAHQITDDYVVHFHEWYETTNHLWLVLELCTGGSLQDILDQDERLPLSEIKKMALDLCRGIHQLHKNDICVGDLSPSRLLLDGPGVVKINNLSCAHFESEEIEAIYQSVVDEVTQGIEADSLDEGGENAFTNPVRNIAHHSPQALVGHVTLSADIWSLGSILYRMFTGKLMYKGDEIDDVLMQIKKDSPKSKIDAMKNLDENAKPEEFKNFKDLLHSLLDYEFEKRPTIETVLDHPFWGSKNPQETTIRDEEDAEKTLTQSMMDRSIEVQPENTLRRQKTELLKSINSRRASKSLVSTSVVDMGLQESASVPTQSLTRISAISSSHNLDETEISIMENIPAKKRTLSADPESFLSKQRKSNSAITDTKFLPEDISKFELENITDDNQWKAIFNRIHESIQESSSKVLISILNWLGVELPKSTEFSRRFWLETLIIGAFSKNIRQSNENRGRFAKVFAIAAISAENRLDFEDSSTEKNFKDALLALADSLREQFSRNGKQKLQLLSSLGQMLLITAKIESIERPHSESAAIPVLCPPPCYSLVTRCLSVGEESQVQSIAAQIIENHVFLSPRSRFCHSGTEAGLQLWSMATRSSSDTIKTAGFSALAQVCSRTPLQANSILEKIGLPKFFDTLYAAPQKCQALMMTIIGVVFLPNPRASSRAMANRVCQHRDIHSKLIRLADSPSWLVRAKSFLCISLMLQNQPDNLQNMCKMKLVAVVEREAKRIGGVDATEKTFSHFCLTNLIEQANALIPVIVSYCTDALEDAAARKHPSTGQLKSLREKLPGLSILPHLMSSSVFRPSLIKEDFLENICRLATLCSGENRIESSLGDDIWKPLLDSIISVIEVTCARPELLSSNHSVIQAAIPMLIMMILTEDNSKMLYIKLLSEILAIRSDLIDHGESEGEVEVSYDKLERLFDSFPQMLLSDSPLPLLTLKCLHHLAIIFPEDFLKILPRSGVLEVLVTLTEIQMTEKAEQSLQKALMSILTQIWNLNSEAIVRTLLDNDILEHTIKFVTSVEDSDYDLVLEIYRTCRAMVQAVSEFVKVALKAKSQNAPAQVLRSTGKMADFLLHRCASLEGLIPFILQNFEIPPVTSSIETVKDDKERSSELVSLACSTVSLTLHMWGADSCQNLYNSENLDQLVVLIEIGNSRNQRLILKLLRKSIQNKYAKAKIVAHSKTVAQIKSLSASSTQDIQLLASEILQNLP
ncbi:unnamed protein product [Oikopleura dioica]|uniref:Protein kinase domain-containing protein n=1 Tax=Oikopleura dioica TaxID=34765 RepID=E4YBD0_OIKDI|nr:unnamed protein product [Oikopleura dioica]